LRGVKNLGALISNLRDNLTGLTLEPTFPALGNWTGAEGQWQGSYWKQKKKKKKAVRLKVEKETISLSGAVYQSQFV
jgi:hypothetical protein